MRACSAVRRDSCHAFASLLESRPIALVGATARWATRANTLKKQAQALPGGYIDALCQTAATFYALVLVFEPVQRENDVDPLLVGGKGSTCVDAHMAGAIAPAAPADTFIIEERH